MSKLIGSIAEDIAVLGVIAPVDGATGATTSSWGNAANFSQVGCIATAGVISGTVAVKLQQATSAAGAGAKDITGATNTTLTATDDGKTVVIGCDVAKNMDIDNAFTHVAAVMTVTGGVASFIAAHVVGAGNRFGPVDSTDASTVFDTTSI